MTEITEVEMPDGTILEFPDGVDESTMKAKSLEYWAKQTGQPQTAAQPGVTAPQAPERQALATTPDGGTVYQMPDGSKAFSSPAYATNDPEKIAQIMQGATAAETSTAGFDQQAIAQHPIAARGVKFVEGVPFVGSYVDEAAGAMFGDGAKQGVRALSGAMERENPYESAALSFGGTVAGAIPMAIAGAPAAVASMPTTLGGKLAFGALAGGVTGGIEGTVYGYGAGEDGQRASEALNQGAWGVGIGTAAGVAAPLGGAAIKKILTFFGSAPEKVIQRELGVSADAAKVIRAALDVGDLDEAATALQRAGGGSMLADAGQPAAELLDAAANAGGNAGAIARRAIGDRTAAATGEMKTTLDRFLGPVVDDGPDAIKRSIREGTSATRKTAYNRAYSARIDYAAPIGQRLEGMIPRIPKSAVRDANKLMMADGLQSNQILFSVGDDGAISFSRLPDVRQWHYIMQSLDGVAAKADGKGKLGGTTPLGGKYKDLRGKISRMLKAAVPEFGDAQDIAADAIQEVNATDLGYSLLRSNTTRGAVNEALRGASVAEKTAAKSALRTYIDDTMANVAATLTDPDPEVAREAIKGMREMSSRAARVKMARLLGTDAANAMAEELDRTAVAFELRAAISQNSKTAIRTAIQGNVKSVAAPGTLETLAAGEPVNATKRFVQIFTGNTDEAQKLRELGIFEEIATALTETRGAGARRALALVRRAIDGEQITQGQAALIGRTVSASTFLTAAPEARRQLMP